jgi:hypothetical protein
MRGHRRRRGWALLAAGHVILGVGHMRLVRVAHTHEAPPARREDVSQVTLGAATAETEAD